MLRSIRGGLAAALVFLAPAACSGAGATPGGGTPAARAGDSQPGSAAASEPRALVLAPGTSISLTAATALTSRHNHAGDPVTATSVAAASVDGGVVVPAGAEFLGRVVAIAPAPNPHSAGRLELAFTQVRVQGRLVPLHARVVSVTTHLVGRGITGGTAAKVGAGAVVGGVAGRLIGGNTTGALIGAAAGGAAGGVYANATRNLDIVMDQGARIRIALTEPLAINR